MLCPRCNDNGMGFYKKIHDDNVVLGWSCVLCGNWVDYAPQPKKSVKEVEKEERAYQRDQVAYRRTL